MNNRQNLEGNDLDIVMDQMEHVDNLSWYGSREDIEHILWHLPEILDDRKLFDWEYLTDYQTETINIFRENKGKTLEFFGLFNEVIDYYKTIHGNIEMLKSKARIFLLTKKIDKAIHFFDTAINEDEYIGEGGSHYEKAYAFVQLGRLEEAFSLICVIQDKELMADTPRVLYLKHIILMQQNKYINAIEVLDTIINDFKPSVCIDCNMFLKLNWDNPHDLREHNRISSDIDFYETVLISKIKALLEQNQNDEAMALVHNLLINYEKDKQKYVIRKDNSHFYYLLLRYKQIPIQSDLDQDPSLLPIISHSHHHTRFVSKFDKSEIGIPYDKALNLIRDKYSNCRYTLKK